MANRQLTQDELQRLAQPLLQDVRRRLEELTAGDPGLLFALRRKLYKELTYDERSKPGIRGKLKAYKRGEQGGLWPICSEELPEKYAVLDRLDAQAGYTRENTRLIHQTCDVKEQTDRKYS
jgi:hypothetical protein